MEALVSVMQAAGSSGLAARRAELRAAETYSSAGGRPADSAMAVVGRVRRGVEGGRGAKEVGRQWLLQLTVNCLNVPGNAARAVHRRSRTAC
eukprot:COSAG05_NODE_593_length_8488_cov_13.560367_7_plen_91_part_01